MNAYTAFTSLVPLRTRWEEARGTWSEKRVLLKIAAEEKARNGDTWLFAAAMDLATRPDERDEHLARFEEELEAMEERAYAATHLAGKSAAERNALERGWANV